MKYITLTLLLAGLSVFRASAQVADSIGIAQFWNEYYAQASQNADRSGYWDSTDNLLEDQVIRHTIYQHLPHTIKNISKLNDSISVITVAINNKITDSEAYETYKVGIVKHSDGYKLIDYLDITKNGLKRVKTKYVDIYYTGIYTGLTEDVSTSL